MEKSISPPSKIALFHSCFNQIQAKIDQFHFFPIFLGNSDFFSKKFLWATKLALFVILILRFEKKESFKRKMCAKGIPVQWAMFREHEKLAYQLLIHYSLKHLRLEIHCKHPNRQFLHYHIRPAASYPVWCHHEWYVGNALFTMDEFLVIQLRKFSKCVRVRMNVLFFIENDGHYWPIYS